MKRVLKLGVSILMVSMLLMTLAGCGYKEAGDFLLEKRGDSYIIINLSEEGYQKKELFIYNQIGEYHIIGVSHGGGGLGLFAEEPPIINSQVLEKIYFVDPISCKDRAFFSRCDRLKRIIRLQVDEYGIDSFYGGIVEWVSQYVKYEDYLKYSYLNYVYPANISYYLNYEIENHDGYHWIDDFDYGSKITYIPEVPTREGYTFSGWYKEEDCINKWDFGTDTLPEAILDEETGEPVYQETKLFAKWIQE